MTEDDGNKQIILPTPRSISKSSGLVRRGLEEISKSELPKQPHPSDFELPGPRDFDSETSLFNAACLSRLLAHSIRWGSEFSVVLFSIDGLDDALRSLSDPDRIQFLKEVGHVFSWGSYEYWGFRVAGSEFAITMPATSRGQAIRACNHTKRLVGNVKWASQYRFFVEGGVATYPRDGTTESALMHAARSMIERRLRRGPRSFNV
jgi:GGDEF domain-containing protein